MEESDAFHDRAGRGARRAGPVDELLREQHRFGNGRQSRRTGRGGQALPDARREGRRGKSHVACLPQHHRCPTSTRATGSEADPGTTPRESQIASNVADLHSDKANINNDTALDEQGRPINSQGAPNRHDILTGSTVDGKASHDDLPELDEQRRRPERDARATTIASRSANLDRPGTRPTRRKAARRRTWSRPAEPG